MLVDGLETDVGSLIVSVSGGLLGCEGWAGGVEADIDKLGVEVGGGMYGV